MAGRFNIKNSLHYGVRRILRTVAAPVQLLYQKLFNLFSPDAIVGKVSADVRKEIRTVGEKPDSLKGYYAIGSRYVAKKLVYVLLLLLILLPALYVRFVFPWIESRFLVKTMVVNSVDMEGYTGRVRLVGDREQRNVIFEGTLTGGRIHGQGTLYDYEGHLLYRGGFAAEQYEGAGE